MSHACHFSSSDLSNMLFSSCFCACVCMCMFQSLELQICLNILTIYIILLYNILYIIILYNYIRYTVYIHIWPYIRLWGSQNRQLSIKAPIQWIDCIIISISSTINHQLNVIIMTTRTQLTTLTNQPTNQVLNHSRQNLNVKIWNKKHKWNV